MANIDNLSAIVKEKLIQAKESTADNKRMILNLALSYGGRDEIIFAVKKMMQDINGGKIKINEIDRICLAVICRHPVCLIPIY